jgi:hypothetical protein
MAINKQQINVTTIADLGCSRPQAPAQAHRGEAAARKAATALSSGLRGDAAGGPSCSQILRESAWLKPDGGNDTRGAWLMASLSRDAYAKFYRLPHSNTTDAADGDAFKCAWGAKLARLGAQNVTFISGPLIAAAVARAGGNVFVVFRGTSSVDEEENNGLWAGAEAFMWYRTVSQGWG